MTRRLLLTGLLCVLGFASASADDFEGTVDVSLRPIVIVHGGAGTTSDQVEAVLLGARAGWAALEGGGDSVDAVVAATAALEDSPRFNAGTGSNIRMDGETVQMDAAVMNSRGDFGAVAVIERVKNPVLVAREVMHSPHLILAGEGATNFARSIGMPDYDTRTHESLERYAHLRFRMKTGLLGREWDEFDWKSHWNFPHEMDPALIPKDTVGAVASDGKGGYSVASSTGGTATTLNGRVGDVALMGAGAYAGPLGAVCATGWGEYIIRENLSRRVYDWMAEGATPEEAVARGLALFPEGIGIGLIAISPLGEAAAANTSMAWAAIVDGKVVLPPPTER